MGERGGRKWKWNIWLALWQAMNQNQVKLLWGLRACQTPPSILLAPRQCNSVSSHTIRRKAGLLCRISGFFCCALPGAWWVGEGWRGGQRRSEVRCRGPKEGRSAVWVLKCVWPMSQDWDACFPLKALLWAHWFPGKWSFILIWGAVCTQLSVQGQGQKVHWVSRRKGKSTKEECFLH